MNKKIIVMIMAFVALFASPIETSAQEIIVLNLQDGDLNQILGDMLSTEERMVFESEIESMDQDFKTKFLDQMTKNDALLSSKLQTQAKDYTEFLNSDKQIQINKEKLLKIQENNLSLKQITNLMIS
jgi:hypothetical protein